MNQESGLFDGVATTPIRMPELQAAKTQEAFFKYPDTTVTLSYGRNSAGELIVGEFSFTDKAAAGAKTSQPFPKYIQNSTAFDFVENPAITQGETIKDFFYSVILGQVNDIRKITAVTQFMMAQSLEVFERLVSPELIKSVKNKYYSIMVDTLKKYSSDPKVADQMKDYLEIFQHNGPNGVLSSMSQISSASDKYADKIYEDPWMKTDEFGMYTGGREVLSFTHTGDLVIDGKPDLRNVKVAMNFEYVPAAQSLQVILTGGGLQKFDDPTRHAKIFKGKDGSIDEELKEKVMNFYNYLISALMFVYQNANVPQEDIVELANSACTVIMEVIQETSKSLIPEKFPELTTQNYTAITKLIQNFFPLDFKPNPEITTVTTSIIFPNAPGEVIANANNTADEILEPVPLYMNLEELMVLIDQGLVQDQRLIAAAGVFIAKELFNLN